MNQRRSNEFRSVSTMKPYQHPEWSQPPKDNTWFLIEIKAGTEMNKYSLNKRCLLAGRALDVVEVPLHHESVSRLHARIAFDQAGQPWLRDLQSTHGTTCNKRKLPPEAVGKNETTSNKKGSRGVMIFPGDILQFGASTRLFCVEGPAGNNRGAVKASMVAAQLKAKSGVEVPIAQAKQNASGKDEQVQNAKISPSQIDESPNGEPAHIGFSEAVNDDESDVDFYDRTKHSDEHDATEQLGDSEATLVPQWRNNYDKSHRHERKLQKLEERRTILDRKLKRLQGIGDEDSFFVQNDLQMVVDEVKATVRQQKLTSMSLREIKRLLAVINPKLVVDAQTGFIGLEHERPRRKSPPDGSFVIPSAKQLGPNATRNGSMRSQPPSFVPPRPIINTTNTSAMKVLPESSMPSTFIMPPPKRLKAGSPRQVLGPPASMSAPRQLPIIPGFPSSESAASKNEFVVPSNKNVLPVVLPSNGNSKADQWTAPKGQDGSGITKLNERFKGRY